MRRLLHWALLLLVLALCTSAAAGRGLRDRVLPLDAQALAVDGTGGLVPTDDLGALQPGSRVLAGPGSEEQRQREADWLAAGTVPTVLELGDSTLLGDALLDLRTLTLGYGVQVAGWTPAWRYVWPRDSALAAVALARTGHRAEAAATLDFLARVQSPSGRFAARYLPDGSGVPDDRAPQLDGVGWALWALDGVVAAAPAAERPALLARWAGLRTRATAAALEAVDTSSGLPAPSSDYWERPERRLTLATVTPVLAGLRAAARLAERTGDQALAAQTRRAAERTAAAVQRRFAADGYPRRLGGPASSVDLGLVWLLPPFGPEPDDATLAVWRQAPRWMLRPAGGLAPGGDWRDDGISWTTATSSYALSAAALGDRGAATTWLRWLDAHRTAAGSLPEKVLADGRPAAVAPLAWPSAAVLLAALELQPAG